MHDPIQQADAFVGDPDQESGGLSRRSFLGKSATLGAVGLMAGWTPAFVIQPAEAAASSCPAPAGFPAGLELYRRAFRNWSGEIAADDLWSCAPRTNEEVLAVVNWAWQNGFKVRPRGMGHNWSPLLLKGGENCESRIVLVETSRYLTRVRIDAQGEFGLFSAQTGVTMEALLKQLERVKLGFVATPAPGDLTLGGVLAIDGHGTGIPAQGESRLPGQSYGSLSNSIVALTAVVWDGAAGKYVLKTFRRDDPACAPFLVHLGRAFIVEATLQAGVNKRMRCQSYVNIPASEMFAAAGSGGRTFDSFLQKSGRAEAIWFPFTDKPWLKVWTPTPRCPFGARAVNGPFNYPFSDNIPKALSDLLAAINTGHPELTPLLGKLQYDLVVGGMALTLGYDLWGWSKDLLLYIKPSTLRVTANGYAVLTRRRDVQRVINEFYLQYQTMVAAYRANGHYPMNGPVEIRVSGLDQPGESIVPGAQVPSLSAIRPRPDQPEWDTAIWLDILSLPGTPQANAFYHEFEAWLFDHFSGDYASLRVEWSKGWGYSPAAAWDEPTVVDQLVAQSLRQGLVADNDWDSAVRQLNEADPHRLFSSPLLDRLMP
ncbi:cholesterol oxidase substrate-binding domain-containing protein [Pseudomonas aeruginosa]